MGQFQETSWIKTEAEHILASLSHYDLNPEQDKVIAQLISPI